MSRIDSQVKLSLLGKRVHKNGNRGGPHHVDGSLAPRPIAQPSGKKGKKVAHFGPHFFFFIELWATACQTYPLIKDMV